MKSWKSDLLIVVLAMLAGGTMAAWWRHHISASICGKGTSAAYGSSYVCTFRGPIN